MTSRWHIGLGQALRQRPFQIRQANVIAIVKGGRVAIVGDAAPACAVIPQDEGVPVGREALDAPANKIGQHLPGRPCFARPGFAAAQS